MSYEIIKTVNGPLVKFEDKYISLIEHHLLIDACEENETLLAELQLHILEQIRDGADEVMDAFRSNLHPQPAKLYSYTNAASQYLAFVNGSWASYVVAKDSA